jgi:uncharacterized protein YjiS (DUF1127 family)
MPTLRLIQSDIQAWWRHGLAAAPLRLLARVIVRHHRQRQRYTLAQLDDRMLRDMGISRSEAERESAKPFWRD